MFSNQDWERPAEHLLLQKLYRKCYFLMQRLQREREREREKEKVREKERDKASERDRESER